MGSKRQKVLIIKVGYSETLDPEISNETLTGLQQASVDIIQSQRRFSIQFVLEHMTSLTAIYALYQRLNNNEFVLNSNRDIQLLKITSARYTIKGL